MTSIITVGCDIAGIHQKYSSVHDTLFGAASYRLVIATMTRRTTKIYGESVGTLEQLRVRLAELTETIPTADAGTAAHQADQLRAALTEYVATLNTAIVELQKMYTQLMENEDAYCTTPEGGKSAFNQDKIRYDRLLLRLEKHGSNLNQLFSRF